MWRRMEIWGVMAWILIRGGLTMADATPKALFDFSARDIDGPTVSLATWSNQVALVVNVASRCGFTGQYAGLERLYRKYKERGFVVLAFPANDFLGQEPGTDAEIKEFCTSKYDVTFPLFSKISVKGDAIHPLYQWLVSSEASGEHAGPISWNFNKFLLDRRGRVMGRFGSRTAPEDKTLVDAIEAALAAEP